MHELDLKRVGKYEILGLLGEGGMARVYRARMQGLGRATKNVALKLIHGHLSDNRDFVLMFLDEMRLAMALEHRNIVQTFDASRGDEGYYLVMELIEGPTLRSLLDSVVGRELLPLELALFIGMEVCSAIEFAHNFRWSDGRSANLVHRDVSPSNVLLSKQGDVKLADFGVAKAMGGLAMSQVSSVKGKLCYMAPEQARGEAGRRSDLFSVGAVIYEMVCGRPLRDRAGLVEVADGLGSVVPPSRLRPGLSRSLEELLLSCLAVDPLRRPASAEEIRGKLGEELFRRQLEVGTVLDAHAGLRAFLAATEPAAAPSEPGTVDRLARALLEVAKEGPPAPAPVPAGEAAAVARTDAAPGFDPDVATQPRLADARKVPVGITTQPMQVPSIASSTHRDGAPERARPATASRNLFLALAAIGLLVLATLLSVLARQLGGGPKPARASLDAGKPGPGRATTASATPAPQGRPDAAPAPGSQAGVPAPDASVLEEPHIDEPDARPPVRVVRRLRPGRLSVNSRPWAFVYVDGVLRGETPLQDLELPAGSHQLRLSNPTLKKTRTLKVVIRPGEQVTRAVELR